MDRSLYMCYQLVDPFTHVRTLPLTTPRWLLIRTRQGCHRTPMEILRHCKYQRRVGLDAFDIISPLPSNLDRQVDGLGPGIHGKPHLKAQQVTQFLAQ